MNYLQIKTDYGPLSVPRSMTRPTSSPSSLHMRGCRIGIKSRVIKSRCSMKPNEQPYEPPPMLLPHLPSSSSSSSSSLDVVAIERWPSSMSPPAQRYSIVALCFLSFMLCNLDRVNMSVAILPMAAEFNWSAQVPCSPSLEFDAFVNKCSCSYILRSWVSSTHPSSSAT